MLVTFCHPLSVGWSVVQTGQGPHSRRMILHPRLFGMIRHPNIYRKFRHPHSFRTLCHPHICRMRGRPNGPRATQPSDDSAIHKFIGCQVSNRAKGHTVHGRFVVHTGQEAVSSSGVEPSARFKGCSAAHSRRRAVTEMFKGISHPPEEMRCATTELQESVTVSGTMQGLVAILRSSSSERCLG